jgi:hypothetical protein
LQLVATLETLQRRYDLLVVLAVREAVRHDLVELVHDSQQRFERLLGLPFSTNVGLDGLSSANMSSHIATKNAPSAA